MIIEATILKYASSDTYTARALSLKHESLCKILI